jgi:hypothetical protein
MYDPDFLSPNALNLKKKREMGYEHRYGDNWEAELIKAVSKDIVALQN